MMIRPESGGSETPGRRRYQRPSPTALRNPESNKLLRDLSARRHQAMQSLTNRARANHRTPPPST
ncbi:hypothetical protein [Arthrobacter zhaoguopingii]|uniref:hypothetical protein n=1 Tax=Arthrobacter zhaoguopingii TaxID=2681491 RepID=UPI00135B617D|nr:hypothetical protein [Arthrobacter zhaoguopingii]